MRKNKGITLIALVITIIVLLILAGISIATLTGENGVLTKSNTAKVQTEIENAKEQAKLDIIAWTTEKMETGDNTKLNDTIVKSILKDKDYVKGEPGEKSFISKQGEHEILYSDLYQSEAVEEVTFMLDGTEVTIPAGYTWGEVWAEMNEEDGETVSKFNLRFGYNILVWNEPGEANEEFYYNTAGQAPVQMKNKNNEWVVWGDLIENGEIYTTEIV